MIYKSDDQRGMAMVVVMLSLTILMILAASAISYGLGSQNSSKRDQDWQGALSAAEAGIDDYIFRLNENTNYTVYNSSNAPPDGNLAFGQYVPIPGGSTTAYFRYSVDTSTLVSAGTITLTSTGKVRNSKRTVQATLRRRNFLDYLYFTDKETVDPASYTGNPFTDLEAEIACGRHYYDPPDAQHSYTGRLSQCSDIVFITADTINGPMHSNDAIKLCGSPNFTGKTSTSWNPSSGNRWRDSCPTSSPDFTNAGDPKYLAPLAMPPSNLAIRAQTTATAGGCLYTGPTRIRLLSSGQMTVKSPFSKQTNNSCPTNGTGNKPSNGVIYVQNVPSTTTDANYTSGCPYNVNSRTHPLGLPIANDLTTYGCRNGDAFVEGTLNGTLTIAADNNIDITWNLQYNGGLGGTDLLGLIANNFIEVWHPVNCSSGNNSSCDLDVNFPSETARNNSFNNPTIQAALLAINHGFRVQNSAIGAPLGTLNLTGVIGQKYRGPVGTSSGGTIVSGYAKNYTYDQRLKYQSPPKFLDPVASAWGIAVWKEIQVPAGL
jgi:hypothetical protein